MPNSLHEKPKTKMPPSFRKFVIAMWVCFMLGVLAVPTFFIGVSNGLLGEIPSFDALESPQTSLATHVYDNENTLIGRYYIQDRTIAYPHEIPPHLIDALIATEDARFLNHTAIDFRSLVRVLIRTVILRQRSGGGGSTITQQIGKNLYHKRADRLRHVIPQKLKEWVIAVRLEKSYTKEELATMYLNTVPYGSNAYGIKSAARVYFNTTTDSLKIQEAAVLVGLLKGNTWYNPQLHPERSKKRRNVVLAQMAKYGKITEAQKDSLQQLPLELQYRKVRGNENLAPYFLDYVKEELKEWAAHQLNVHGESYDIEKDGLRIYTTLNAQIQKHAEHAVQEHMAVLQEQFYGIWNSLDKKPWQQLPNVSSLMADTVWTDINMVIHRGIVQSERYKQMTSADKQPAEIRAAFDEPTSMNIFTWQGDIDTLLTPLDSVRYYKQLLHTGFLAMNPNNGHVLAWVGDINHRHFQYDHVKPSTKHQVGSTFKPIVYTLALQNGWTPCHKVPNIPVTFEEFNDWTPENSDTNFDGQMVTIKTALANSINIVAARLMKQLPPESVIQLAQKMGIDSTIEPYPSICLGVSDISLYEMVSAYTIYAQQGFHPQPMLIKRIEDKNGNVLQRFRTYKHEAMDAHTAYAVNAMMQGVVNEGTAKRLRSTYNITAQLAGKTGTTSENSDGWFIGIAPKIVAGAWVGGSEKAIRFPNTKLGQGANTALPIYAKFMQAIYTDSTLQIAPTDSFAIPQDLKIVLNCDAYEFDAPVEDDLKGSNSNTGNTMPNAIYNNSDYNNQFDD